MDNDQNIYESPAAAQLQERIEETSSKLRHPSTAGAELDRLQGVLEGLEIAQGLMSYADGVWKTRLERKRAEHLDAIMQLSGLK